MKTILLCIIVLVAGCSSDLSLRDKAPPDSLSISAYRGRDNWPGYGQSRNSGIEVTLAWEF